MPFLYSHYSLFWHDSSNRRAKKSLCYKRILLWQGNTKNSRYTYFPRSAHSSCSVNIRLFEHEKDPWEKGNKKSLPDYDGIHFVWRFPAIWLGIMCSSTTTSEQIGSLINPISAFALVCNTGTLAQHRADVPLTQRCCCFNEIKAALPRYAG